MDEQLSNVAHDYIRYANCWEDADVLLSALEVGTGDHVLSIGSAGDNSFSLLCGDPELVVAVDINLIQLHLIELKKAAFRALDHSEFLQFLGFTPCDHIWELFTKVRKCMSAELSHFWSVRKGEIEAGIIHQGKFEKYFQLFHSRVLPLIHTKKRIRGLIATKEPAQQVTFYEKQWNNLRWKLLFKVFFSKFVMGRFGRDPAFLSEVQVPVSTFILDQSRRHLTSVHCQDNYFLHYILSGSFGTHLPHFARAENFERIKTRLDRLVVYQGLAEEAFAKYPTFSKFNLSDIFEYMPTETFRSVAKTLVDLGESGARYAYWNLMVPRVMSQDDHRLAPDPEVQRLRSEDKGFFYGNFLTDVKS